MSSSDDFVLPYARGENGILVSRESVDPDSHESFRCPACDESLSFRREHESVSPLGNPFLVSAHFAHRPDSECSGESVEHKTATELAALAGQEGRFRLLIPNECNLCCKDDPDALSEVTIPSDDSDLVNLGYGNGRRADTILLFAGKPVFGVEVFHKHKTLPEKAATMPISWAEIMAAEILASPRGPWHMVAGRLFGEHALQIGQSPECLACRKEREKEEREEREESRRAAQAAEVAARIVAAQQEYANRQAEQARRDALRAEQFAKMERDRAEQERIHEEQYAVERAERARRSTALNAAQKDALADKALHWLYSLDLIGILRTLETDAWLRDVYPRVLEFARQLDADTLAGRCPPPRFLVRTGIDPATGAVEATPPGLCRSCREALAPDRLADLLVDRRCAPCQAAANVAVKEWLRRRRRISTSVPARAKNKTT